MLAAYRAGIPCTVHVALGTDIVHMHPHVSGAALGEASLIDFRLLCTVVSTLGGGVWMNLGSAVVMPEVFLKAVGVVRNFGHDLDGLVTVNLDKESQYRTGSTCCAGPVRRDRADRPSRDADAAAARGGGCEAGNEWQRIDTGRVMEMSMAADLIELVQRLGQPRVLVVGDVMLDRYVWGDAERISQEAPVILLRADRREERLGGASSVATMLRALGRADEPRRRRRRRCGRAASGRCSPISASTTKGVVDGSRTGRPRSRNATSAGRSSGIRSR